MAVTEEAMAIAAAVVWHACYCQGRALRGRALSGRAAAEGCGTLLVRSYTEARRRRNPSGSSARHWESMAPKRLRSPGVRYPADSLAQRHPRSRSRGTSGRAGKLDRA
eukprot:3469508-Prymnesium_polylepis.3